MPSVFDSPDFNGMVQVGTDTDLSTVVATNSFICGRKMTGEIDNGQLGYGTAWRTDFGPIVVP